MVLRKAAPAILVILMSRRPEMARAQSGAIVSGAVGAAVADHATDLELSGGIGYRFNRAIGFGIEFTHVPNLDTNGQYAFSTLRICCGVGGDRQAEGHATVFTTN